MNRLIHYNYSEIINRVQRIQVQTNLRIMIGKL